MTEAMSLEEMEAAAAGVFSVEESAETSAENDNEAQQEDENAEESADFESAEDESETESEEDEEDTETEEQEEKPRMNRASQRVKEAVDRANEAERRLQELEFKFQQQMQANEKLMAMITGEQKPDAESGDDEILDEALAKRMEEKFGKLEDQQFNAVKAQELNYIGGEHGEVYQKAVAASALSVMRKAQSLGKQVSPQQAEQMAQEVIQREMRELHKRGAQPGAIAQEIMNAASYYDFMVAQQSQQRTGQKQPNGVNMKKVSEARRKAGAPTIDKESVNLTGGMNAYQSEVKRAQESGIDVEYMRKLGFA